MLVKKKQNASKKTSGKFLSLIRRIMRNKPQLIDPSFLIKPKKVTRVKKIIATSSRLSLDVGLVVIFFLFGGYLYFYRKRDPCKVRNDTEQQLREIQKLNYQYFTNNS
jgi:hypothetical protein